MAKILSARPCQAVLEALVQNSISPGFEAATVAHFTPANELAIASHYNGAPNGSARIRFPAT
jgi:hypothetical protein